MIRVETPTPEMIREASSWPVWNKEPSTFSWQYDTTETCLILEGSATVTAENGESVVFGAGDYVVFPQDYSAPGRFTKQFVSTIASVDFSDFMDFIKFTLILVFGLIVFGAAMMFLFRPQG